MDVEQVLAGWCFFILQFYTRCSLTKLDAVNSGGERVGSVSLAPVRWAGARLGAR